MTRDEGVADSSVLEGIKLERGQDERDAEVEVVRILTVAISLRHQFFFSL